MKNVEFTLDSPFSAAASFEFVNDNGRELYEAGAFGFYSEDGGFIAYADIDAVVQSFTGTVFVMDEDGRTLARLHCKPDKILVEI